MTIDITNTQMVRNAMLHMGYPVSRINYFIERASGQEKHELVRDAIELGFDYEAFTSIPLMEERKHE